MEDPYQDVIRGSPVERKPDRAALDAAIDRDAGTSFGAQDHGVQPLNPPDDPPENLSGAQIQTRVKALPQKETALIDYDLGTWNSLTLGSTTQDGWVQRWSFESHIVHFPSNFSGRKVVAEPGGLPVVSHMEGYSDATDYRSCDWEAATDRATIGQRVHKHIFDASIAEYTPRIRRLPDVPIFPYDNVSPSPECQPATPVHIHGPLSMRHFAASSNQTSRELTRDRGKVPDDDSAGEPHRRRLRSRSPIIVARPRLDRDRDGYGARRQRDVSLHYSDGGRASHDEPTHYNDGDGHYREAPHSIVPQQVRDNEHPNEASHHQIPSTNQNGITDCLSPEPGHVVPHNTGLTDLQFQREKNKTSICCNCWTNGRPCDHQWPCRECKVKGKSCAYIACPIGKCPLEVKCPAYHILPGLPEEKRKVGSPMHLLALLGLNRSIIESYDVRKIQEKVQDPNSAQQIYLLLEKEFEQAAQLVPQGKKLEDPAARKLLRESEKVPAMREKTFEIQSQHDR